MSLMQDTFAIFKKKNLRFLESNKESDGVYSFLFEKEENMTWKAGQHGLFTITHKKIKSPIRPFSIASAPAENVVRLTMRIGEQPSEFKKAMLELEEGMQVKLSGPVGKFYLEGNSPTLLIAGGIGITPFRSIVKQLEAENSGQETKIHLLYLDSNQVFTFKDEFDRIAANTSVAVTYLVSREDLSREIDDFSSLHSNEGKYYLAGPKGMVDALTTYLKDKGIAKRNIVKDAFPGY